MMRANRFSLILFFQLLFSVLSCKAINLLSRYNVGDQFHLKFSEIIDTRQSVNNLNFDQFSVIESDLTFRIFKKHGRGLAVIVEFDHIAVTHLSPVGRFSFSSDSLSTTANRLLHQLIKIPFHLELSGDGEVISVQRSLDTTDLIKKDTMLLAPDNEKILFKSILSNLDSDKIKFIFDSFFPAIARSRPGSKLPVQFSIPAGSGLNGKWSILSSESSSAKHITGNGHFVNGDSLFYKAADGQSKRTVLTGNLKMNIDLSKTMKQIAHVSYDERLNGIQQIKEQEHIITIPISINNVISIVLTE